MSIRSIACWLISGKQIEDDSQQERAYVEAQA